MSHDEMWFWLFFNICLPLEAILFEALSDIKCGSGWFGLVFVGERNRKEKSARILCVSVCIRI